MNFCYNKFGDYMNNRGFAITTVVYSILMLLSISMFLVLGVMRNNYNNEKTFMNDINDDLNGCLNNYCSCLNSTDKVSFNGVCNNE